MNNEKFALFIKEKRKKKKLTQKELADKLFVTEKAISRWETGRGMPEVSLLIPLSEELEVSVSELLNGGEKLGKKEDVIVNSLIDYLEINKRGRYNVPFLISIICYVISIFVFLLYLKFDYKNIIYVSEFYDYFIKIFLLVFSSVFILIGNYVFGNKYIDKLEDKKKLKIFSNIIIGIYYIIFIFNLGIFARDGFYVRYNLFPLKTIKELFISGEQYSFVINVLGNFFIFMPISYFLIEIFNLKDFKRNILISFVLLVLFEIIQFIFKIGTFDVDDIILRVLGIICFYVWYYYFNVFKLRKKIIYIISSIILILLMIWGYFLLGFFKVHFKYDEDLMKCEIIDNVVYTYIGSNIVVGDSIIKEYDNEVLIFINEKVELKNMLFHKDIVRRNKEAGKYLYGVRNEFKVNSDVDVRVYYTNASLKKVKNMSYDEVIQVSKNSNLMCSKKR